MFKPTSFLLVIAITACVEGKHYATRCDLVRDLRAHGFPANKMADWVCLIEAESSRTTSKVGKVNKNGSRDYGLFQINDKYWCSNTNAPGKDCNVLCSDLLTDDITKASLCAKKVFRRHGFNAWYGWKNKCRGALPNVSSC